MSNLRVLDVTAMSYGGDGVARHDGKVHFVQDGIEGDQVEAAIEEEKKSFARALTKRVVRPSVDRRAAPCPVFDRCGGCQWQHARYDAQLTWKAKFVTDALAKFAGITGLEVALTSWPAEWNYRNRVRLKGRLDQDGRITVGYHARKSHDLVVIQHCPVAAPEINTWLEGVSALSLKAGSSLSFEVEVQQIADQGKVALYLEPDAKSDRKRFTELQEALSQHPHTALVGTPWYKPREAFLYDEHLGLRYFTRPGVFQQVHRELNRQLREDVLALCGSTPLRVLDVFCGSGNLSLPLMAKGFTVTGVEASADAITLARLNLSRNELPAASFTAEDATRFLQRLITRQETFDIVLLDPPRAGLLEAATLIPQLRPNRVVYVACDPNTLARDVKIMGEAGYHPTSVRVYDFFPQTYHVETRIVLDRK